MIQQEGTQLCCIYRKWVVPERKGLCFRIAKGLACHRIKEQTLRCYFRYFPVFYSSFVMVCSVSNMFLITVFIIVSMIIFTLWFKCLYPLSYTGLDRFCLDCLLVCFSLCKLLPNNKLQIDIPVLGLKRSC